LGGAAIVACLASGWALAGTCTAILPAPMVTLCPNQPALATDLNANFSQLITWLQQKSGPITSTDSTVQRLIPSYVSWNAALTGGGGAGIVNDNSSFKSLMVVGNSSAGGGRKVSLYDDVLVGNDLSVTGDLNAATLTTLTPVTGAVLGGGTSSCNGSSSLQRGCTAWGVASCGAACNSITCSKGTARPVHQGYCYNVTDGAGGYCLSTLCIQ
jgi:hypothetical protein